MPIRKTGAVLPLTDLLTKFVAKPLTCLVQTDTIFVWGDLTRPEALARPPFLFLFSFGAAWIELGFRQTPMGGYPKSVAVELHWTARTERHSKRLFGRRCHGAPQENFVEVDA
jgi:hypothetical protein